MDKDRNIEWDIVRGIGIILVVIGHCLPYMYFVHFIYLFHMGLFFISSGIFFKCPSFTPPPHTYTSQIKQYVFKKIKSLYVPWVVTNICLLLIQNYCVKFNLADVSYHGTDYLKALGHILLFGGIKNPMLGPLWFLRTLFGASIILYVVMSFVKSQKCQMLIVLTLYLAGMLINMICEELPYNIERMMIVCFVIYIGYLLNKYKTSKFVSLCLRKESTFLIVLFLLIAAIFIRIDLNRNEYSYLFVFPLMALLGTFMCLKASSMISKIKGLKQIFSFLGRNSLYILILHVIAFKFISILIVLLYNLPYQPPSKNLYNFVISDNIGDFWWVLYAITGLTIPVAFVYIKNIKSIFQIK